GAGLSEAGRAGKGSDDPGHPGGLRPGGGVLLRPRGHHREMLRAVHRSPGGPAVARDPGRTERRVHRAGGGARSFVGRPSVGGAPAAGGDRVCLGPAGPDPRMGWGFTAAVAAVAVLGAFLPSLLLPVLAARESILDFGTPRTAGELAAYLSGARYTGQKSAFAVEGWRWIS